MSGSAIISPCGAYRYELWRHFNPWKTRTVMFIGLNPSTADAAQDDATIRRCSAFAKAWGFGSLCMVNLFAFRATLPEDMFAAEDPIGEWNDDHLLRCAREADLIIAAWGVHGAHMARGDAVRRLIPNLQCLGLTQKGFPRHPLYLPSITEPRAWSEA